MRKADGDRGTKMGEVIQGPWRRPQSVDFMRVLREEIARMTHALEDLRELHQRRGWSKAMSCPRRATAAWNSIADRATQRPAGPRGSRSSNANSAR
jgi:hypothetical protein